jgi:hypothetical protein
LLRLRHPIVLSLLFGLLVSTMSLGPLSPATTTLATVTVAMSCDADDGCGGDMTQMLELLQRTQQFQQIQEEEEHQHRDPVVAGPASHGRVLPLPEPLALTGEDRVVALLRPPCPSFV